MRNMKAELDETKRLVRLFRDEGTRALTWEQTATLVRFGLVAADDDATGYHLTLKGSRLADSL